MKNLAVVPYTENDGKKRIKFDKASGEKSQGTGWSYAVFCCLHRTTTSEEEKGDSISLHSPVSLLLYPLSPLSIKDTLTISKFRKEGRMNTWLKDGFFCSHLLQSMDDYHSYYSYRFLFLLVPVLFIAIISPAFSLQPSYKMSQLPPSTTSQVLPLLHCRPSYEKQGWGEQKACDLHCYMLGELLPHSRAHNTPFTTCKSLPLWPDQNEKRWKEHNGDGAMDGF